MKCVKCKKEIMDDSVYCNYCGKKQTATKRKQCRRPNGTGSVYKLSGKRAKPFIAFLPATKNSKGVCIGAYSTKTQAETELSKLLDTSITDSYNFTVEQYYNSWSKHHYATLTKSGSQGYKTAWNYLEPIKSVKMRNITVSDLQQCIDIVAKKYSRAQCEKVKQLCSQLCKHAMQDDTINKNYAQFLVLPKSTTTEKLIFEDDQIETLFKHAEDSRVQIILALIYTGFRLGELFSIKKENVDLSERIIVAGSKSEAGRNRTVPIIDKIYPFIETWYNTSETELLINKDASNFRKREFYPALFELEIINDVNHPTLTPHSCRHTFASLCSRTKMKTELLQKIIGHADYSTTANIYIHPDIEALKDAMNAL